jgi:integrase
MRKRVRHRNDHVRKLCTCARRNWPKCRHSWYFNFKPAGGPAYRFSLDVELGHPVATKEAATAEAERIRGEIRAGVFIRATERRKFTPAPAATPDGITLETFAARYVERVSEVRERNTSWKNDKYMFAQVAAFQVPDGSRLGDKPLGAITEDDLEVFLVALRARGRAASTRNQYVQLLKASCRWATRKGYLARNPISEDSAIKRAKIAQRNRRLVPDVVDEQGRLTDPGEERRLLAAAGPRLQNLILAAVETCCRRGELLSLQWRDVNLERGEFLIRGEKAKDGDTRRLPISARLLAVLTMAKTDPAGDDYPADAYVFGEIGQPIESIKRAWDTCVLKAHGHVPVWRKSSLAPASRAALQAIDLHFHDLRYEGASRLLEAGWPLHHVQEMLGHASIDQTSTYLNVQRGGLRESMRQTDERRSRCNLVAIEGATAPPLTDNTGDQKGRNTRVN